jgi:hypothetical protein
MELIQDAQNKQKVRKALQLVALLPIVWPTETDCARAKQKTSDRPAQDFA